MTLPPTKKDREKSYQKKKHKRRKIMASKSPRGRGRQRWGNVKGKGRTKHS